MYCSKCGEKLADNAKFCAKCGTVNSPEKQKENKKEETPQREETPQKEEVPKETPAENAVVSPNRKKNSGGKIIGLGCLGVVVIVIGLSIWGFIVARNWYQDEIENNPNFWEEMFNEETDKNIDDDTDTSLNNTTTTPSIKPEKVVTNYINNTLGMLPNSNVDYDAAKKYLSSNLKQQIDTPGFVPLSYCIQDGPTSVNIGTAEISGNTAIVTVGAEYGGNMKDMWDFNLKISDDDWVIASIDCLAVN
ncbi:MAG: zinc ribbon domain-containing protein [bacterium]